MVKACVFTLGLALILVSPVSAGRVSPLAGIAAASHARTKHDSLGPAILADLRRVYHGAAKPSVTGTLLTNTSRFVGNLPGGRSVYVASTTNDILSVIVTRNGKLAMSEGVLPLSSKEPVTIGTFRQSSKTKPISFGIAEDGVVAVSFRGGGGEHTVPVRNNLWGYVGDSSALESITVHYADGTSRVITH
jgi:hypothetical protein